MMIDLNLFKVSIIIPCFNHNDLLDRCLASIEKQTHKNIEVIIIDDGSYTPVTLSRRYAIKDVAVIRQENSGLSSARNRGIKAVSGSYIKFLDADDELLPQCIEEQLTMLVATQGNVINVCGFIEKYESHEVDIIPAFSDPIDALINFNIGPPHCYFFPKKALEEGVLFSTESKVDGGHEDYDFIFRIALSGYRFSTLHNPLVIYHKSEHSMSTNQDEMQRTLILVWVNIISALLKDKFEKYILSRKNIFCIIVKYFELVSTSPKELINDLTALQPELLVSLEQMAGYISGEEKDRLLTLSGKYVCLNKFHEILIGLPVGKMPLRPPHRHRVNDVDYFFYGFYSSLAARFYDDSLLEVIDYTIQHEHFSIYGAGALGQRLVFLLNKIGKKPDYIIDKKLINQTLFGIPCITSESDCTDKIQNIIIASRAYREEIRREIGRNFANIKTIIDM